MKSSNDFFQRLKTDEAFAKDVADAIQKRREEGATNYYETFIPVAEERGYEITKEELDALYEAQTAEMSEEELGKVAGGASCFVVVTFITVISVSASVIVSLNELSIA